MDKLISSTRLTNRRSSYFYHIGTFTTLGFVAILPLAIVLYLSLTEYRLGGSSARLIGLRNYIELFSDNRFSASVLHTLYFVGGSISLEFILGFGLALLLNRAVRGTTFYRLVLLVPLMCMPAALSMIWRIMYNRTFGILTHFVTIVGFSPINWLGSKSMVIPALILVDVWQWTPFVMIILLAGLQSLPKSCFEAASIAGASRMQTFVYITFPLMRFHIFAAVSLRIILGFKEFDKVWIITEAGPGFASELINVYTYTQAFLYFRFGYGSAIGIAFCVILLVISIFTIKLRGET